MRKIIDYIREDWQGILLLIAFFAVWVPALFLAALFS